MTQSLKSMMLEGVLCCLSMCLTSCEDILGEWSKPTPVTPTETPALNPVATITVAPTATSGDIAEGSTTALVTIATADGGTVMYEVTVTNTKPASTDGFTATVPTAEGREPGTYYVWYYVKGDATHTDSDISSTAITITVIKPIASVTTAPTATSGVIYAGSTTALVTAGAASGGTMMYKVTNSNSKPASTDGFTATVPTAEGREPGTYYVWYYVKGDATHTDSDISSTAITVTISNKPAATVTTAPTATTGDIIAGSTTALVTAGTVEGGTMLYKVTTTNDKPASTEGFTTTVPTAVSQAAGTCYVWYYAKADTDHSDSDISSTAITVTVSNKPAATIATAPTATTGVIYAGSTTALITAGAATGGTMMYKVTTTNTKPTSTSDFSDMVPTAASLTTAGTYYVWYYAKGDTTHADSEISATAISVTVKSGLKDPDDYSNGGDPFSF